MDRGAGILMPDTVTGSDSVWVAAATLVLLTKLKASGAVSGLQPWSKRSAESSSAFGRKNDLFVVYKELS